MLKIREISNYGNNKHLKKNSNFIAIFANIISICNVFNIRAK